MAYERLGSSQKLNDPVCQHLIMKFIPKIKKINGLINMPIAMDVVQKQVFELSDKVDGLYQLMEQLSDKVTKIAELQSLSNGDLAYDSRSVNLSPVALHRTVDPTMMHKDILIDEPHLEGDKSSMSPAVSPQIQIQRLTAQLTAAYNRMAALEEQILACRFQ